MESLSYKLKLMLLAFAFVALGILSFRRAINPTLEVVGQYYELIDNKSSQQDLLLQTNQIKAELKQVEQFLGNNVNNVQHSILDEVSSYCKKNRIHLAEVEKPIITFENDLKTSTYEITLQGNFKKLLQLVHHLEYDFKDAVLVSTEYYTKDNHTNKNKELYAKLYLQSINKI